MSLIEPGALVAKILGVTYHQGLRRNHLQYTVLKKSVAAEVWGLATRRAAISALEKVRGRPLITYVTSRRENAQTGISSDIFGRVYEHLRRLKQPVDEIDLFLMTYGGDVTVPLPLQHLLREYCKRVNVLVPAECFSAGTMIALGADSVVMTPLSQLSPIDPTVNHPMNPASNEFVKLPAKPDGTEMRRLVGVEVEQIFSYLSLASEKAEIQTESEFAKVFLKLSDEVHPLTLGEIHRIHTLIRLLARRLLEIHTKDKDAIEAVVGALTEKLYTHGYKISRREARDDLRLPVENADEAIEKAMMDLREAYISDGQMDEPFVLGNELQAALPAGGVQAGQSLSKTISLFGVAIESNVGSCVWTMDREVRISNPPGGTAGSGNLQTAIKEVNQWKETWY